MLRLRQFLRVIGLVGVVVPLSGCSAILLHPAGDIAVRERDLVIASTGLMLLIILPVIVATLVFAWRYRASNTAAVYDPNFHHSTQLEVLIWTAPLMIIIALGALTWISTHLLDPYRSLGRIDASRPVAAELRPLTVEVVALDWKWLFFYPDQGIATVNELATPIDVPINFRITSATVMNSFFIPALAGQIYAMAGMETKLHAVANRPGTYEGFSGNYSGAGFSRMHFKYLALSPTAFTEWVAKAKTSNAALDLATYRELEKPSEGVAPTFYSKVAIGLYDRILNLCVTPGSLCVNQAMRIDAAGGAGTDSGANRERLIYDGHRAKEGTEEPGATFPVSGRPPNSNVQPQGMKPDSLSPDVNTEKTQPDAGQGHMMPGMAPSPAPAQLQKN